MFQNADYGGLKGYEVFILYSRFNNFKKIKHEQEHEVKGREKILFPGETFYLRPNEFSSKSAKRRLIKEPVPTPETIVEHYFRLTCRKRRMVSSSLLIIPRT